jgi:hypothetical protein
MGGVKVSLKSKWCCDESLRMWIAWRHLKLRIFTIPSQISQGNKLSLHQYLLFRERNQTRRSKLRQCHDNGDRSQAPPKHDETDHHLPKDTQVAGVAQ